MFFEFQNFSASKLGFIIIQPSLLPQIQRRLIINLLALAKLDRLSLKGQNQLFSVKIIAVTSDQVCNFTGAKDTKIYVFVPFVIYSVKPTSPLKIQSPQQTGFLRWHRRFWLCIQPCRNRVLGRRPRCNAGCRSVPYRKT